MLKHKRGLRPMFKMPGGKFYLAPMFARAGLVPPHDVHLSAYGGAASEKGQKRPCKVEVYNDADWVKWNVFDCVQKFAGDLHGILKAHDRRDESCFDRARLVVGLSQAKDFSAPLDRDAKVAYAAAQIIASRWSRAGMGQSFAWSDRLRGGQPGELNSWDTFLNLEYWYNVARIKEWFLLQQNAPDVIRALAAAHVGERLLIYCDPTYLRETRSGGDYYGKWEMTPAQHLEMIAACNDAAELGAMVTISGYDSQLYRDVLKMPRWQRMEFDIASNMGQTDVKRRKTEVVWFNFEVQGNG